MVRFLIWRLPRGSKSRDGLHTGVLLYRHRKRGKKRLDFTPFRSKMRFRVKSAGFLHEILRLDRVPWSATRHDRTDASVHICVAGPPCRRLPLPRQMAPEHSLCHMVVVSYGAVVTINLTSWGYLGWCQYKHPVIVIFCGPAYMFLNVHIICRYSPFTVRQ